MILSGSAHAPKPLLCRQR